MNHCHVAERPNGAYIIENFNDNFIAEARCLNLTPYYLWYVFCENTTAGAFMFDERVGHSLEIVSLKIMQRARVYFARRVTCRLIKHRCGTFDTRTKCSAVINAFYVYVNITQTRTRTSMCVCVCSFYQARGIEAAVDIGHAERLRDFTFDTNVISPSRFLEKVLASFAVPGYLEPSHSRHLLRC